MFQIFGEKELPMIKSTYSPSEIANWKNTKEVADCYKKLFQSMDSTDALILDRIIDKVLPFEENRPLVQVALIVTVCTTMLNPKYERIQLGEKIMKNKVAHFLVSFCNLFIQNITKIILTTETQLKKGYKIGKMHYVRFTGFNAKLRTINLL